MRNLIESGLHFRLCCVTIVKKSSPTVLHSPITLFMAGAADSFIVLPEKADVHARQTFIYGYNDHISDTGGTILVR